jgi:hypothetical protein
MSQSIPRTLLFGSRVGNTEVYNGIFYLRSEGIVVPDTDFGIVMPRDGSVTGVGCCWTITSWSLTGDVILEARVNDVAVLSTSFEAVGNETVVSTTTQAPGIDTFSAGDKIQLVNTAGFAGVRFRVQPIGLVEVVFDD